MFSTRVKYILGFALLLIVAAILTRLTGAKPAQQSEQRHDSITLISHGKAPDEYLTLKVSPGGGNALSVTGLLITDGKHEVTLGSAVPLFAQGKINTESPIVITRPSTLIVITGESPLGVSFRENKCTGLLVSFQTFTPPLTPACENCNEMAEGYPDYNSCVNNHRSDADFFVNTWRIYLGSDQSLWQNDFQVLRIYNQQGKLIALFPLR